jgi:hypothetical protein
MDDESSEAGVNVKPLSGPTLRNINILMNLQAQLPFWVGLYVFDDERRHLGSLIPFGLQIQFAI